MKRNEDYYLEYQSHSEPTQQMLNKIIVELGKKLGVKYIVTTDAHYLNKDDQKYHSIFLMAKVAPKKSDKIIPLTSWTLGSLIDAGCEVGVIDKSAKSFSIAVRDFRNYIHPNEQVKQSFSPTIDAAKMSYGVLGVAIKQIGEFCKSNQIM